MEVEGIEDTKETYVPPVPGLQDASVEEGAGEPTAKVLKAQKDKERRDKKKKGAAGATGEAPESPSKKPKGEQGGQATITSMLQAAPK